MTTPTQKVALVTGGSRGIGRAIVVTLAEAGFDIVFNYVSNRTAATEVENTVRVLGREVLSVQGDVGSAANAQFLIDETMNKFGRLDVLVNNAGVTRDNLLIRMKDDEWNKVIETNLTGTFYTMRSAAKVMMKQRIGSIVNITSVSGVYGNPGQVNYSASKAGMIGATKAAAKELASRNITVNAVAPGFITTDMTDGLPTDKVLEHIPLGRLGSPEDIANAVLFLVTSGNYITGQVLQVDGGLVL
jgi:3-oxoacyl-[acyl-carrier protein] reductase